MVGRNYYEYYRVVDCLEFDISWHAGTWTFSQRWEFGKQENSTIHIPAGRDIFILPLWKDIFSLPDIGGGFMITDFDMDPNQRKIRFHGHYYMSDGLWLSFISTFWFSLTGFYVRVKYEDEDADGVKHFDWELSCFQQPDTTLHEFQNWDNEFHNPPFIKPVYDNLFPL